MRIYLPATTADLASPEGLLPRWAHAVTPALRAALPEEDEEGWELAAMLAAADDSVDLLAADDSLPRRLVVAADVEESAVRVPDRGEEDRAPSAVEVTRPVSWTDVVSLHVDEDAAAEDVAAAAVGDEAALDRAAERDLLWYDVTELADLRRELGEG